MLDKELASQLTDGEKDYIERLYLELLPKILTHPESLYEGSIEGTSKELINTLAKTVIALRAEPKEQEKTKEVIANIIVEAVPEDELIKMVREAVDENEKKIADLNKHSRYEEENKYTL